MAIPNYGHLRPGATASTKPSIARSATMPKHPKQRANNAGSILKKSQPRLRHK